MFNQQQGRRQVMPNVEARVVCRTPTPGKRSTNIPKWKYDAIRKAIVRAVPKAGDGIPFRDLAGLVETNLTDDHRRRMGSIPWYTVTVKLEMEVSGELRRVEGSNPQRLLRTK
jgi:hypothetical protein